MSFLRPAAVAALRRWREPAAAALAVAAGLWLASLGGWLMVPVGGVVTLAAAGWALTALRRMRFVRAGEAPGVVEVDEGQVGYLGPTFGGFVALDDMQELRLVALNGQRLWRLRQVDGQVLMIPTGARGAERLFDAFATLPGLDMKALVAALDAPAPAGVGVISLSSEAATIGPVIWRRPARAVLT
ncbi:hypothetical protein LAZ40_07405 [Cereibacter sphaeroides]|uniref:hypothetical protein n=1 Tax=Rhodobacterales TaxID=204455 RepID=UPI000BBEBE31|nr:MULTISPECIES: hypothetical protein [Paracoccaceae]MCE6951194.1 hypothetical protein [Cereibacter sphaeroides]MCE6958873.1 hypothetical protein [Cereibacter sphaeroides]MCE6973511.1 hypothetical protein [Cereibacter sphaeroides]